MTVTVMFDSIDLSQIPASAPAVAGYTSGKWPTYSQLAARFPGAKLLSIAVTASANAQALDIENGDAAPAQAPAWTARQISRGVTRPVLYASVSVMDSEVLPALERAGIARTAVRLWTAHYDGEHICGPSSCRQLSTSADGTQWTDAALGRDLDQSALTAGFFGSGPAPTPAPTWETAMIAALPTLASGSSDASQPHWYVHRVQAICNAVYGTKLTIDGVYGPSTVAAVKTAQRSAGITADGQVGPQTWGVLLTGAP